MKNFILLLLFMNASISFAARLGGEDNPSPWPQNQAPSKIVGRWLGTEIGDEIVVKYLPATKETKNRLFVTSYRQQQKMGQGYLYYSDNQMYCGYIHNNGPVYTLCIWKDKNTLKSQTLEKTGEWRESLWTH